MPRLFYCIFLLLPVMASAQSRVGFTSGNELDFISDTQQPMAMEKILLPSNHNEKATSLLLSDILKNKPQALFMLGDVVAIGSGNHDVMWSRKKGEKIFW